jgi:hypothetical protein
MDDCFIHNSWTLRFEDKGCTPECYEWAAQNGFNCEPTDNCKCCPGDFIYYPSQQFCGPPGLSWNEVNDIIGTKFQECGAVVYNPPAGMNSKIITSEDLPTFLPGLPPAEPDIPSEDIDSDMAPIDTIIDEITDRPTKRPRPDGAPEGTEDYEPCRQYTEEEKKEYRKKKCMQRQYCKEAGYGYRKWKPRAKKTTTKKKKTTCSCK